MDTRFFRFAICERDSSSPLGRAERTLDHVTHGCVGRSGGEHQECGSSFRVGQKFLTSRSRRRASRSSDTPTRRASAGIPPTAAAPRGVIRDGGDRSRLIERRDRVPPATFHTDSLQRNASRHEFMCGVRLNFGGELTCNAPLTCRAVAWPVVLPRECLCAASLAVPCDLCAAPDAFPCTGCHRRP
jgi:hypothetical protein